MWLGVEWPLSLHCGIAPNRQIWWLMACLMQTMAIWAAYPLNGKTTPGGDWTCGVCTTSIRLKSSEDLTGKFIICRELKSALVTHWRTMVTTIAGDTMGWTRTELLMLILCSCCIFWVGNQETFSSFLSDQGVVVVVMQQHFCRSVSAFFLHVAMCLLAP